MVSRREKMFRSYVRMKNQVFEKQSEILMDESLKLTSEEEHEVLRARVGNSLFDKFYCVVFEDVKKEIDDKTSVSNQKLPNPYAKSYSNSVNTRSRRRTISQSMFEDSNQECEPDNEMPVLTKCKSEEYLSSDEKQSNGKISFTHSPFVIKVAPKLEANEIKPVTLPKNTIHDLQHNGIDAKVSVEENYSVEETKCLETITGVSENDNNIQKILNSSSEVSSDKNSLCLSDKENINGLAPVKLRKTRSDSRHLELKNVNDFSTQNPDIYDDDSCLSINSEISVLEGKRMTRRSTRYHMRARSYNAEIIEIDDMSVKSADLADVQPLCSPSNTVGEVAFLSQGQNSSEENSPELSQNGIPRKKRGRPRKINQCDSASDASFTVIKSENGLDIEKANSYDMGIDKTNSCVMDVDKVNECSEIMELSDSNESTGFRMSLRHNRECLNLKPVERKSKRRRSVMILENDCLPLKRTNKRTSNDSMEDENSQNPPAWNSSEKIPKLNSPDKPASTRIIIRLRKDRNGESWKNDSSSSSSDGNVAFRIVHNNLDVNGEDAVSHFPSIIKDEDSVQSETYPNENRHRYMMRDRPILIRTAKCNLGRS